MVTCGHTAAIINILGPLLGSGDTGNTGAGAGAGSGCCCAVLCCAGGTTTLVLSAVVLLCTGEYHSLDGSR